MAFTVVSSSAPRVEKFTCQPENARKSRVAPKMTCIHPLKLVMSNFFRLRDVSERGDVGATAASAEEEQIVFCNEPGAELLNEKCDALGRYLGNDATSCTAIERNDVEPTIAGAGKPPMNRLVFASSTVHASSMEMRA